MYASWTIEEFALGTINGDAMTDVMEDSVTDFVFGCTKQSTHLPLGSIGFDSSPESLPSQLVHENFSFSLLSLFYDDTRRHSALVLNDDLVYNDLSYTPLVKGPGMPNFYGYRYVNLEEIIVGINRSINIPHEDRNQDLMGMVGPSSTRACPDLLTWTTPSLDKWQTS
ncbi:Asp domain-containing protein [Prunus yedoensis var. nudiflora]|uniref:Asp domain-containing protein n=1 Tax=Prunus yedoensis var. nudiflora TaxID=2094558 RepID=A0A314UYT8_PRUYE|nr:Asp domain-containing protein [Prunus yedoensis var. nudiflora]